MDVDRRTVVVGLSSLSLGAVAPAVTFANENEVLLDADADQDLIEMLSWLIDPDCGMPDPDCLMLSQLTQPSGSPH